MIIIRKTNDEEKEEKNVKVIDWQKRKKERRKEWKKQAKMRRKSKRKEEER